ncbi:transcriptional regulator [Bacilli bacterium]|nr:transcriptional regulator [Bacilli bacterium]
MLQKRMKELRLEAKLTQKEVAEKLGISTAFYGQWETGKRTPASKNLQKIADVFNVSVDYLLGNTDEKNPSKFGDDIDLYEIIDNGRGFNGKEPTDEEREEMKRVLQEYLESL